MIEWFKDWWWLVLWAAVTVTAFTVLWFGIEAESQEQRQEFIECVERTDDTEWCLDITGL